MGSGALLIGHRATPMRVSRKLSQRRFLTSRLSIRWMGRRGCWSPSEETEEALDLKTESLNERETLINQAKTKIEVLSTKVENSGESLLDRKKIRCQRLSRGIRSHKQRTWEIKNHTGKDYKGTVGHYVRIKSLDYRQRWGRRISRCWHRSDLKAYRRKSPLRKDTPI